MITKEEATNLWNAMSERERYFRMHDELGKSSMGQYTKEVEEYSRDAAKSRLEQLPAGLQRHALRAVSAQYSMQEDYAEKWIPTRGAKYGRWKKKDMLFIGDFVHVEPFAQVYRIPGDKTSGNMEISQIYGPTGTFGRIIAIRVEDDPVDSVAMVQLSDGRKAPFFSYALTKADQRRLKYGEWQGALTQSMFDEIHDLANQMEGR